MMGWLWLLPLGVRCACEYSYRSGPVPSSRPVAAGMFIPPYAYTPAANVLPPFNCSGHTILNLTARGLQSLNSDTFILDTCKDVTDIFLGCNDFDSIGPGAFNGLNLQFLWLIQNPSFVTINNRAFNGLTVGFLFLGFNPSLATISPGAFDGITVKQMLGLGYNPLLATIDPEAFDGLTVKTLFLSNNPSLDLKALVGVLIPLTVTEIDLTNNGFTFVPERLFANKPNLTIYMSGNPSDCSSNAYAPSKVTCSCAASYFDNSQKLVGGEDGYCICPAGQYAPQIPSTGVCLQCPINTYSETSNELPNCTVCPDQYISNAGSTSASDCVIDPVWQARERQRKAVAEAKLVAETAAHEAQEHENEVQNRDNLIILIAAVVITLLMVIGGGGALYRSQRQNLALTEQLNKVAEQREELSSKGIEISYLRNWR